VAKKRPKERLIKIPRRRYKTAKVKILGLDCSSSTVGWGLVTITKNKPTLVAYGHLKPLNSKHPLIDRLDNVYERIGGLCEMFDPSFIAVEDILLFMKGRSGAKTITTLAVFNRIMALSAHKHSDAKLKFYPVQTIRKLIKNAHDGITVKIAKTDLPDIIRTELEPSFENVYNTKGAIADETYDEGDGIATAWACALDLLNRGVL
jgi:Holliday junction resolvasome RuvABC endonuclease subunit